MEESQGHEGKYASGEGQGGRVLKTTTTKFHSDQSLLDRSCGHSVLPSRKGRRAWSQGHVPIALRAKEELGRGW